LGQCRAELVEARSLIFSKVGLTEEAHDYSIEIKRPPRTCLVIASRRVWALVLRTPTRPNSRDCRKLIAVVSQ